MFARLINLDKAADTRQYSHPVRNDMSTTTNKTKNSVTGIICHAITLTVPGVSLGNTRNRAFIAKPAVNVNKTNFAMMPTEAGLDRLNHCAKLGTKRWASIRPVAT